MIYIFVLPDSQLNFELIIRLLTCTFNGHGGNKDIGATWYVFVVMWLYLLTPVIHIALKRIVGNERSMLKQTLILIICLAVIGLIYRILGRMLGLQWYDWIYANVLGCADLYIIGMLTNKIPTTYNVYSQKKIKYAFWGSSLCLILLIISCSIFYFYGETSYPEMLAIYRYVTPTAYAIILSVFILSSVNFSNTSTDSIENYSSWYKTISKFINIAAKYTFSFYMWHTAILYILADHIVIPSSIKRYFIVMIVAFIITFYIAFLMTNMNESILNLFKTKRKE